MSTLSWKFDENLFIPFPVMLQTWISLKKKIEKETMHPTVIANTRQIFQIVHWIMPDISWKFHENPTIRFFQ